MIPLGYMYKKVENRPDWLEAGQVESIYSVSPCVSGDFCDWVNCWKHNGYWLFDRPDLMAAIAAEQDIALDAMTLFFYRGYELQWDDEESRWLSYEPEGSFLLDVTEPDEANLAGYDVVSYSAQTSAECSPLSCNHLANELKVNRWCLFDSFDEAKHCVESGAFKGAEPGPLRIIEVSRVVSA